MKSTATILTALLMASLASADVRLPRIFSDHMVFQRDMKVNIWGWAVPDEDIVVQFGGQKLTAKANKDGAWTVALAPMRTNSTGQELNVAGKNSLKLTDILIGDVWMVSGQSNAAFGLGGCKAPEDIANANFPLIRFSGYLEHFAGAPMVDGGAAWKVVSPSTAGECSAIGFYFARKIQPEAGVPIGILTCAVGAHGN